MEKVKVLHIISGLGTGGAEMMLYKLLRHMSKKKIESAVICLGGAGFIEQRITGLGVPVTCLELGTKRSKDIGQLLKFVRFTRWFRPNLIQGWMYHGNLAAVFASVLVYPRAPVVWNIRQSFQSRRNEKLSTRSAIRIGKYLSRATKSIIYNSREGKVQHEELGYSRRRGCVIPNGFDLDEWCPDASIRREVRREFGIPEETSLVGHSGRFHPKKDHPSLFEALNIVSEKDNSIRFLLIGRGVVYENPEILKIVGGDRFNGRCLLLGERQDVERIMKALDILVISSAWGEGFPNVLGEAMATGLCCVSTDVGESSIILGRTGIVVPPGDVCNLAKAIMDTAILSSEKKIERGQQARARIAEHYSILAVSSLYEELYFQCGT